MPRGVFDRRKAAAKAAATRAAKRAENREPLFVTPQYLEDRVARLEKLFAAILAAAKE
jgi:hypothetical protein